MGILNKIRALFGRQQVHLAWFEPYDYITALRNDVELRLIFGLGAAGIAFCFCMVMIASEGWYNYPAYLVTFLITAMSGGGGFHWPTLRRNRPLAGEIAIRDHDIVLKYHKHGYLKDRWLPYYGNYLETITVPYSAIHQCQLVPAEAMKTRFSLLLLQLSSEQKIIVMPNRIDRNRVKRVLAANGVELKLLAAPPMGMTPGINSTFAYGTALCGGAATVVGLFIGLIAATVPGVGGPQPQANAAPVAEQPENRMPPAMEEAREKAFAGLDKPWENRRRDSQAEAKKAADPQPFPNPWAGPPMGRPAGFPDLPSGSSQPAATQPAPAKPSFFSPEEDQPESKVERAGDEIFTPNPFGNNK